jgi:REP element-mobilizing transposase RayT
MARPLRIELAGGLYHVTSRGNRRESVYESDADRQQWLLLLGRVCERFNWRCHAYCLMDNHYHIVIETAESNLSKGMRQLNGVYTQYFNRQHNKAGHVFQGRFKGILVEKDFYLLELSRYVVLNPIRAGMVNHIEDWNWSSYQFMCHEREVPSWMETTWILRQFSKNRKQAINQYIDFVRAGIGLSAIWSGIKKQIYLGSEQFVGDMLENIEKTNQEIKEIPLSQRREMAKPLADYQKESKNRNEAIRTAFSSGAYTMKAIGDYFGLHYTSISRIVNNQ